MHVYFRNDRTERRPPLRTAAAFIMFRPSNPFVTIITASRRPNRQYDKSNAGVDGRRPRRQIAGTAPPRAARRHAIEYLH